MAWFTYLLRCGDGSFYAGITTDLSRRLKEHQGGTAAGGAKYTASHPPVTMVAHWEFPDRSSASKFEAKLKKMSHKEKERL